MFDTRDLCRVNWIEIPKFFGLPTELIRHLDTPPSHLTEITLGFFYCVCYFCLATAKGVHNSSNTLSKRYRGSVGRQ